MFNLGKKRVRVRISKKTRFMSHMLASAAFIGLFIWGWDLQVSDAVAYLIISIVFLTVIVGSAAVFGWLMRIIRSRSDIRVEDSTGQEPIQKTTNSPDSDQ